MRKGSLAGQTSRVRLDADGEVRRITNDLNYYHGVSVTADSRVVATVQVEPSFDVWVADMAALDSAKPIIPDGRTVWADVEPERRDCIF